MITVIMFFLIYLSFAIIADALLVDHMSRTMEMFYIMLGIFVSAMLAFKTASYFGGVL